ncbi:transposase [Escherichia coli]|nr:transposase [Escherichia coli]
MPRRLILSATERDTLLALPESQDDLIRYYTFNDSDLSLIRQRRGDANRLGFAVQLCLLRYPGYALGTDSELPEPVILWVAKQVQAEPASWAKYGERDVTRREHAQELRTYLQLAPFGLSDFRALVRELTELAQQTDKGLLLAGQALESLRQKRRILPALSVIDRACSEAIARANRRVYRALVEPLTDSHRAKLDELLKLKAGSSITWLTWLRQAPLKPNSRHMLEHIERLKTFQLVDLPEGLGRHIHQNRLLKLAREGGQMTPKDLGKFEPQRRYATLAAVVLESTATVIDELVDLHDRILVKLFSGAKHKHQQQFQKQGKAINDKVRLYSRIGQALLEAKESGSDPYAAIEAVIPWDEFTESVSEAELLARPEGFDHLHLVGENFATLRRYTPALLEVLELRAAPAAQGVLAAVQTLREMNADNLRKVPADAPTAFIKPRWKPLVITPEGLDRKFYEICALSELKNALRSGDIWVKGSRQFRDFDDYLLPAEKFAALKREQALPLAINPNSDQYLEERLQLLDEQLATVTRLAKDNELPDAILTESGLKITPLDAAVPDRAQALIDQTSQLLPRIKITELLMDVQRYAPEMEKRLRWYWRNPSDLCPWHMDETYVKVNGRWAYLYRAVDSRGRTVDFYLSSRRNSKAAYRFLGKILNNVKKWQIPRFINTDKAPAYGRALALLKREGRCPSDVEHRQIKYRNNVIECDHGKLKRIIGATLGFKSMKTAYATIKGIEVMRALRKGQASAFYYGDPLGEIRLVSRVFEM